jgi:hypothetical protein
MYLLSPANSSGSGRTSPGRTNLMRNSWLRYGYGLSGFILFMALLSAVFIWYSRSLTTVQQSCGTDQVLRISDRNCYVPQGE